MKLIHSGFVVNDRAAADNYYKRMLGFMPYWHGGMKDGETDWVAMQVPDGTDWIEYMLNIPADADKHSIGSDEPYFVGCTGCAARGKTA